MAFALAAPLPRMLLSPILPEPRCLIISVSVQVSPPQGGLPWAPNLRNFKLIITCYHRQLPY
jgi:hypothetical protein